MRWIYLSPHLDDVVLSCGGLLWQQAQRGERVEIWTIFAGDAPAGELLPFAQELHARWETGREAGAVRRAEDAAACRVLGAEFSHWTYADCIYRLREDGQPLIENNEDLFQPAGAAQQALVDELTHALASKLPARARLVCPLGIGSHIDHSVVRSAADALGRNIDYYCDYPYVVTKHADLAEWIDPTWREQQHIIEAGGLQAWQDAVACYTSQISTFWGGEAEMRKEIEDYVRAAGGCSLFHVRRSEQKK